MAEINEGEVARYWDGNSAVWADQVRKGFDRYRELINNPSVFDLIGPVDGLRILDAGCGEGHNTRKLARMGARLTGIDISEKMVERAVELEEESPLGITYHRCSFSRMSILEGDAFDMAVAFMSLMDGPDFPAAMKELHRVLHPGGNLVFSITHPCFFTEGMRWFMDERTGQERVCVGNYFKNTPYVDKWKFSMSPEVSRLPEFEVPNFPRTLSEYVNGVLHAGFQLVELREPRPTEEDCRKYPALEKWRNHAAIFLQVRAQKPA